jgi:hypothetical protein
MLIGFTETVGANILMQPEFLGTNYDAYSTLNASI